MSHRGPTTVADRHLFNAVIDARSPLEFAEDHLPGAVNLPVLDDEERRIVGTLYKQHGAFEARRLGGGMVAANLGRHLRQSLAGMPSSWKPLVYCWRGGMRSGSMVTWLRMVGWDAQQLQGGYKRWRQHVIETIARIAPQLPLQVLCGPTGSAKTRVLHALAAQGAQVIDLEGLARHKGSLLGHWPGQAQPSQKAFETQLATVLEGLDLNRPVFIEAESRKIGQIALPTPLVERLRSAPCLEICASVETRLAYLLRDYAYLGDDPAALARRLWSLREAHGAQAVAQWQTWAHSHTLAPLFEALATQHYDPLYARSQSGNFKHWAQRRAISAASLDDEGIAQVAQAVLGAVASGT
jgi:tRNA 2-selenouridine synthase